MSREMDEEGHANAGVDAFQKHEDMIVCPVCRKPFHEDNLVDMKSVVEDNLYYVGGVRIVGNTWLYCDFEHRFDEKGVTMNEPHKLVAVVNAEFDGSGKCIQFDIVEVLPTE